jgi:hypothetical protein
MYGLYFKKQVVGSFPREDCDVTATLERDTYEVPVLILVEQGRGEMYCVRNRHAQNRSECSCAC